MVRFRRKVHKSPLDTLLQQQEEQRERGISPHDEPTSSSVSRNVSSSTQQQQQQPQHRNGRSRRGRSMTRKADDGKEEQRQVSVETSQSTRSSRKKGAVRAGAAATSTKNQDRHSIESRSSLTTNRSQPRLWKHQAKSQSPSPRASSSAEEEPLLSSVVSNNSTHSGTGSTKKSMSHNSSSVNNTTKNHGQRFKSRRGLLRPSWSCNSLQSANSSNATSVASVDSRIVANPLLAPLQHEIQVLREHVQELQQELQLERQRKHPHHEHSTTAAADRGILKGSSAVVDDKPSATSRSWWWTCLVAVHNFFHARTGPAGCEIGGYIRIGYALLFLYSRSWLAYEATFLFHPQTGVLPYSATRLTMEESLQFSIFQYLPHAPWLVYALFFQGLTQGMLLLLGIAPRLQIMGVFFFLYNMAHHNSLLYDHQEIMLRVWTVLLFFLPLDHMTIYTVWRNYVPDSKQLRKAKAAAQSQSRVSTNNNIYVISDPDIIHHDDIASPPPNTIPHDPHEILLEDYHPFPIPTDITTLSNDNNNNTTTTSTTTLGPPSKRRRSSPPLTVSWPMWPFRVWQIYIILVYSGAAFCKLASPVWMQGMALYYTGYESGFQGPDIIFNRLWGIQLATWSALAMETVCIFTIWPRTTRKLTFAMIVLLHVGIELTMSMHIFQYLSVLGWLVFLVYPNDDLTTNLWSTNNVIQQRGVSLQNTNQESSSGYGFDLGLFSNALGAIPTSSLWASTTNDQNKKKKKKKKKHPGHHNNKSHQDGCLKHSHAEQDNQSNPMEETGSPQRENPNRIPKKLKKKKKKGVNFLVAGDEQNEFKSKNDMTSSDEDSSHSNLNHAGREKVTQSPPPSAEQQRQQLRYQQLRHQTVVYFHRILHWLVIITLLTLFIVDAAPTKYLLRIMTMMSTGYRERSRGRPQHPRMRRWYDIVFHEIHEPLNTLRDNHGFDELMTQLALHSGPWNLFGGTPVMRNHRYSAVIRYHPSGGHQNLSLEDNNATTRVNLDNHNDADSVVQIWTDPDDTISPWKDTFFYYLWDQVEHDSSYGYPVVVSFMEYLAQLHSVKGALVRESITTTTSFASSSLTTDKVQHQHRLLVYPNNTVASISLVVHWERGVPPRKNLTLWEPARGPMETGSQCLYVLQLPPPPSSSTESSGHEDDKNGSGMNFAHDEIPQAVSLHYNYQKHIPDHIQSNCIQYGSLDDDKYHRRYDYDFVDHDSETQQEGNGSAISKNSDEEHDEYDNQKLLETKLHNNYMQNKKRDTVAPDHAARYNDLLPTSGTNKERKDEKEIRKDAQEHHDIVVNKDESEGHDVGYFQEDIKVGVDEQKYKRQNGNQADNTPHFGSDNVEFSS